MPAREQPRTDPDKPGRSSLELRLGTFWAPRIGIVVLLTGLVFIGNLAYQNLGPLGRILLLYLASGILLGTGWWWQRRTAKETLRNYAQVLFAGGLAALYFTTYAAHHLEPVRVISSSALDGLLLLVCAGLIVYTAHYWKSEVLALFGAGLAYYTCIITRVGSFTLYSNLVLAAATVFFLARNRWAALTFGAIIGSYGAYGFWRFFNGSEWHWATPEEGLWSGVCFLAAYWAIFTANVFLTRHDKFADQNRAAFLTLNNGAFFTLFVLSMIQVGNTAWFWKFTLAYGAVLLGLSEAARVSLKPERLARDFYLSQGLLLVTVGMISKFAGLHLAMVLAAESVLLLLMSHARKSLVLMTAAYITAGLSVAWAIDGMRLNEPEGVYLAGGIGGLMLANALLVHHAASQTQTTSLLRPDRSYFVVLALVICLVTTYDQTAAPNFPLVLILEGLALTFSIYLLRVREISVLGQAFVIISLLSWFSSWFGRQTLIPWWSPHLVLGASLLLCHWWQHQKRIQLPWQFPWVLQEIYALGIIGLLWCWFGERFEPQAWMVVAGTLAVGLTAYGVLTRAWLIAATAQVFVGITVGQLAHQLSTGKPGWTLALGPLAVLLVLSFSTVGWFRRRPNSDARIRTVLLRLALLYRWVAIALFVAWIYQYIPIRERIWAYALTGLALFLVSGWKKHPEALLASAVFTTTGLALFWLPAPGRSVVYGANLAAILALLAQQQTAKILRERYPLPIGLHVAIILAGSVSIWRFANELVLREAGGLYLTATWSLLALIFFACGILLRERTYRWFGLGLLACALGRIVIFDIWKLQTLYRILSFMALGIVLLVLGYIYSKYQEKIKEWL